MKKFMLFLKNVVAVCFAVCLTFLCCTNISGNGNGDDDGDDDIEIPGNTDPHENNFEDPPNGIYVSTNGNDATADGSIDKPYKSINTALAAASPGDMIILRSGTYQEGPATEVRIRQPNITIKSKKGEWARINLPYPAKIKDENDGNSAIHFDPEASGCKLQGIEVTGGFYTVCMETKWGWHGDDDEMAASNIIIEDCVLHDSRFDVVKVKPNCNDITIRNNEIYNSGRAFTADSNLKSGECNAEGIDNVNGNRMHVHNNYIHDIVGNGIYAKGGATDVIIEKNCIERIYGAGVLAGFDTSPDFFDTVINPKYYENIDSIIRNNLIIDTGWEGIGLYASKNAKIYNNTIVNAVTYGTGKYHSPIYFGVATQDWDNPEGCPPNVNPDIHHNIVSQPSSYNNRMIDIRYIENFYNPANYSSLDSWDLYALDGNPTMNDNCYYVAGKSATFTDNRPGSILDNAGLAAWQSHIGGDSGSVEVDPVLDSDYMASNAQCAGMGIEFPLKL